MREIKFRGWNGEAMEYGGFSIHASSGGVKPLVGLTSITEDSPIMQYTGLQDADGANIYEGDILHCEAEEYTGTVFFKYGQYLTDARGWGDAPLVGDAEDCRVVGNIHQNPELLNGKH